MTVVRPWACVRRRAGWQRSFRARVNPSLTFRWRIWQGPEVARSEIGPEANQRWLRTQGSASARTRHQGRSISPASALP
jgi:hypothetical protein